MTEDARSYRGFAIKNKKVRGIAQQNRRKPLSGLALSAPMAL
ncbi:hypothetical protein [Pandoraea pnomenusa]|nr:hypothetical protein [Pandoraea pnomenusa]